MAGNMETYCSESLRPRQLPDSKRNGFAHGYVMSRYVTYSAFEHQKLVGFDPHNGFSGTPLAYTHKGCCQVIFCSDIHILAILMVLGFGSVPSAHASEMGLQPLFDSLNHNIDLQCICGGP